MRGPTLPISMSTHALKYRLENESFEQAMKRVANALKDDQPHFKVFRDIIMDMRFLPPGRVQSAMGSPREVTAFNCLSGDTEILTREYGAVPIREVAGKIVTLLDGNGDWVKCPVYDHGEQTTYVLHFNGGFNGVDIRSTLEHGWIQGAKAIRTKAFTHDSGRIEIDGLIPSKDIIDQEQYRAGVEHGIIYGDGSENDGHYTLRLCGEKTELLQFVHPDNTTQPPSVGDDVVCYYHKGGRTSFKTLPETSDLCYLRGFMRGWLATDGCVSTQPHATICCGPEEEAWIRKWAPLIGWQVGGSSLLSPTTNYGERNKASRNLILRTSWMSSDDFLREKHRTRWNNGSTKTGTKWRIRGSYHTPRVEHVYCPVVPTTHSFALACGIHSSNCYVSGPIEDTFVDGEGSIMGRATEAAQTMRLGGGIGYDFSTLRPRGDIIKSLDSSSSGAVSFMTIFDAVCGCVSSAGHRRGAQMGVLRVDHPDIVEFVNAKARPGAFLNFNLSVGITHKFIECLENNKPFPLTFGGKVYREIDAAMLWNQIMLNTWDWAEPGVLFIDTMNDMNNLWYCETIAATNPCGEQPLPPFGACLLGSFNLVKYVTKSMSFDYKQLIEDIPHVVRAMDNVIDRTLYPLPQQGREARAKRRMGLGVTGLANAVEAMGFPYGSEKFTHTQAYILTIIRNYTYMASAALATEKGAFALFNADKYLDGKFIKTLPEHVRSEIKKNGIRNSHLTSIAPTGTISLCADNVSSGIEPVFNYAFTRDIITSEGKATEVVEDYGVRVFGVEGKKSDDVTIDEHLNVLVTAQRYVDSAVSKTCNVPGTVKFDAFQKIYLDAYHGGAKGCTTFRKDGKRMGILRDKDEDEEVVEGTACTIDPDTGAKSCGD